MIFETQYWWILINYQTIDSEKYYLSFIGGLKLRKLSGLSQCNFLLILLKEVWKFLIGPPLGVTWQMIFTTKSNIMQIRF